VRFVLASGISARNLRYAIMGGVVNIVFFTVLELTLRGFGFHYSRFPRLMQQESANEHVAWQNANRDLQHFIPDPLRMWKPKPGFGDVNALGYQGPVLPVERDPAKRRILFLGDSCTNAGPEEYPDKVVSMLARSDVIAEPLIAGVGGYSTYQGLLLLEEALVYRPDAIVAYFGWNDHWFAAAGVPDNEFKPLTPFEVTSERLFSWLRTYQLLHYLIYPPRVPEGRLGFQALIGLTRVPPRYFVDNIAAMIELARQGGIPIFFVAAPYGRGLKNPAHDVLFPAELIPSIHQLYRDLLREVVLRHPGSATLVDVSPEPFDDSLMGSDGIHPTPSGYSRIAEAITRALGPKLSRAAAFAGDSR
jgi:lysophospholipase L1-like esterase